ncbi:unnamed protein product [Sympodiomycopsis kandeliae]
MFVLSTITDTLFIPGSSFSYTTSPKEAATSYSSLSLAINTKYANKVIPDIGLCISLFDILESSEGRVKWGDGGLWHTIKCRLVVFRPFVGEVLVGKVMSSDENGIRVSMGFFDDIHIPLHLLPLPNAFDHQERAFFWLFDPSDPSFEQDPLQAPQEERLYIDRDESIRFIVEDDIFEEGEPLPGLAATGGPAGTTATGIGTGVTVDALEAAKAKRKAPFRITASIGGSGLGLVKWWSSSGQEQQPEEGEEGQEHYDEQVLQEEQYEQ